MKKATRNVRRGTRGGGASRVPRPASHPVPATPYSALDTARRVFDCEVEGLRRVRESLDDSFAAAVDLMLGVLRREEEGSLPAWRKEIASYARTEYGQDTIIHELEELYETAIRG